MQSGKKQTRHRQIGDWMRGAIAHLFIIKKPLSNFKACAEVLSFSERFLFSGLSIGKRCREAGVRPSIYSLDQVLHKFLIAGILPCLP